MKDLIILITFGAMFSLMIVCVFSAGKDLENKINESMERSHNLQAYEEGAYLVILEDGYRAQCKGFKVEQFDNELVEESMLCVLCSNDTLSCTKKVGK